MLGYLGVVETRIGLLHVRVGEPRTSLQEELGNLDVGRQSLPAQRLDVIELRVGAKQAVEQRLYESLLQAGAILRTHQSQAGEDAQPEAPVGLGKAIEGIDERDRLADADGNGHGQIAPGGIDDRFGASDRVVRAKRQDGAPWCCADHLAQCATGQLGRRMLGAGTRSIMTLMQAGLPLARARSSAGAISPADVTSSP